MSEPKVMKLGGQPKPLIIDVDGVKRKVPFPFRLSVDPGSIRVLIECLERARDRHGCGHGCDQHEPVEGGGGVNGWVTIAAEPEIAAVVNSEPHEWDDPSVEPLPSELARSLDRDPGEV